MPQQRPNIQSRKTLDHLHAFNSKYLGMDDFDAKEAALGKQFFQSLSNSYDLSPPVGHWKSGVPSNTQLLHNTYGRPDLSHSFIQEPCLETCTTHVLGSGFLDPTDLVNLMEVSPLITHMAASVVAYSEYDFRWIQDYNIQWSEQTTIDPDRQIALTAALFHYNLDVSALMRYLGNNFTGEHRDIPGTISKLRKYGIPEELIDKYRRVMMVGCPNHFVAETSRDNTLLYFRNRNGPTIAHKLKQVQKNMNKEDKNNFVIPLPHWLARFIPNLFFTPQHMLEIKGKKDRQIFDGSKRYNPHCASLNMMTSTRFGTEDECLFGSVRERIYARIYNLRATYSDDDIIIHANDVKSCFRQLKLHPDIMGAFSYIIADQLFLSCGLPFGTDFSPQQWEPIRQILEILAEHLFEDSSLLQKHAQYLDQMVFDSDLGNESASPYTRAVLDSQNPGVRTGGTDSSTPHMFYVDDDVYSEVFHVGRVKQAAAASIEAVFIMLGESDLERRQDPISFDKMIEMSVSYLNKILGHIINTRTLTVGVPDDFLGQMVESLSTTWGPHRKQFTVKEAAELAGRLNHIAITAPWLKYLMGQVYLSLSSALKLNETAAIRTSKSFRLALQSLKNTSHLSLSDPVRTFHQGEVARAVFHQPTKHPINNSLRKELRFILRALQDQSVPKCSPISHLIPRDNLGWGRTDSCLRAAGGYSPALRMWWYIEWPQSIRLRTLLHVKNNANKNLISINILEYAALLVTFILAHRAITTDNHLERDPYPHFMVDGDNTAAESWAKKGAKHSPGSRALGRLHAALMIGNPIHFKVAHIATKDNVVADKISRIDSETNLLAEIAVIKQEHPDLAGCQRYHLTSCQISLLTEMILQAECNDPIGASKQLLISHAKTTS